MEAHVIREASVEAHVVREASVEAHDNNDELLQEVYASSS